MAYVIVEKTYDPPINETEYAAHSLRLLPCIESQGIRWIRSFVSNDRRYSVCEYEAADAEAVRVAYHTAGVPFKRAWMGECLTPEPMEGATRVQEAAS